MGYLLHHGLVDAAQRDPERPALRFEDVCISYGELDARSNQIARALVELGVRPGDRVGLHVRKSADAIVQLFGVLKAGGCVVPVSTTVPGPRLRFIVDQCDMHCLIVSGAAAATLGAGALKDSHLRCLAVADAVTDEVPASPRPVVSLAAAAAAQSADALPIPTVDRDLAYVLFTSGSTGRPKGVMLAHRAVLTFVRWATDEFAIRPDDRLSNHAPLNFDLSTFDIFAAMEGRASVTVVPEGLSAVPTKLAELIEREEISVWYSVPTVLAMLVTRGGLATRRLDHLRLVLFAGEVFPVKYLRELMVAVPAPRYVNLYGPTETNVCTYYEVSTPPDADARPIPIGKACANTRTAVFDESGRAVTAPGAEGVLYVGGSTVMDGYYGMADETKAVFRNDPSWHAGDARMYCTGDWVTVDEHGDYLFVGRRDHMVKIGGNRVELGEIEAALLACDGVVEAVAVAVPDEVIGNRIKAVVVPAHAGLDVQTVRRHCATQLPKYMVPHDVEFRSSLPRTSTDKVDRPALAAGGGSS